MRVSRETMAKNKQQQPASTGACAFCLRQISKQEMPAHLQTCIFGRRALAVAASEVKLSHANYFHIAVEGRGLPEYWLHLDVRANARLLALDDFLRYIWLECCGHLSKFTIEGVEYVCYDPKTDTFPGEENLRMMTARLNTVLRPQMTFRHEYDFGTTTYLNLTVLSERVGIYHRAAVELLARNDPPDRLCAVCGKPATLVCGMCIYTENNAWYCEECEERHRCDDESTGYFLPVANSPRVGMCGYTGMIDYSS